MGRSLPQAGDADNNSTRAEGSDYTDPITYDYLAENTDVTTTTPPLASAPARFGYAAPIAAGLAIAVIGLVPWTLLAQLNARVRPDLPWAAVVTVLYLAALMVWLDGAGPPARTSPHRRERLRLIATNAEVTGRAAMGVGSLVGLLALLYLLWIIIGRLSPLPDLSAFPTTSYRLSMFIMGGVTAGVVEEAAFRGYMQSGLERHDPDRAIWITSIVFVAAHITQGIGTVLLLGPGLLAASMLYGTLARRTGSILPGMLIHITGDLAYMYWGVLRGNGSLLFVS